jgi:predicted CoA-substrate-specific enzyme activase
MNSQSIALGIDVGATSIKLVALLPAPLAQQVLTLGAARAAWHAVHTAASPMLTALWVEPRRTRGRPLDTLRELLDDALADLPRDHIEAITLTGSADAALAVLPGAQRCNGFQALARAVHWLIPQVRTVFEIGGQTSKYLSLAPDAAGQCLRIRDYGTNGDCAAGTGSFIDQQAGRLQYAVEDIGDIVAAAQRSAQIAGRCSVFAKSDMIHAQQKGFSPPEVLRGLCDAVAANFRSAVVKGRQIETPVAFVGGVAANSAVVRSLRAAFDLTDGELIVPPAAHSFGAIGAALLAVDAGGIHQRTLPPPDAMPTLAWACDIDRHHVKPAAAGNNGHPFATSPRLTLDRVRILRDAVKPYHLPDDGSIVDAYLGLDIGSVGTKLVVINAQGDIVHSIFTRTEGRPIEVVTRCLREIEEAIGQRIRVCGVGSTGSGRELVGELVGADTINDEITAHKTGASFVGNRLVGGQPDTIFEIGGQDSKYIRLAHDPVSGDAVVVDFTMNEACAAGTGSFLEERAEELGVSIKGEFAARALASRAPIKLGERCTVFMERDVDACMQRGAERDDVIAGLAYSVAYNYIQRVVRGRSIGDCIFFQGGTAFNDAVAAAFSMICGKPIIVPPHNALLGALGAALLARERAAESGVATRFRGFDLGAVDYTLKEFTCNGCGNRCSVQQFTVDGEKTYWGDKCSDRFRKRARSPKRAVIADLAALRQELLHADDEDACEAVSGRTVGIPLAMYTLGLLPLWRTFFQRCGLRVVVSSETNRDTVQRGLDATVAEPCFPIIVAHGHAAELVERGVDYLWIPNIVTAESPVRDNEAFVCPWGQSLPFVLRQSPVFRQWPGRILCPTLRLRDGLGTIRPTMIGLATDLGASRRVAGRAFDAAVAAQRRFESAYRRAGAEALEILDCTGESGVLLIGRPYNVHDAGVSLSVARKLRELYGVNVIPLDALPLDGVEVRDVNDNMFWEYGRRILAAGKFVRDHPNLHIIYITNFKCGPDSFIKSFLADASGRPFLTLQFDGHSNDAGMMTRCEAYLDSKGILRWWRHTQEGQPVQHPSYGGPVTIHLPDPPHAADSPDAGSTSRKCPALVRD